MPVMFCWVRLSSHLYNPTVPLDRIRLNIDKGAKTSM
jgi:hypothetical protein